MKDKAYLTLIAGFIIVLQCVIASAIHDLTERVIVLEQKVLEGPKR